MMRCACGQTYERQEDLARCCREGHGFEAPAGRPGFEPPPAAAVVFAQEQARRRRGELCRLLEDLENRTRIVAAAVEAADRAIVAARLRAGADACRELLEEVELAIAVAGDEARRAVAAAAGRR